MASNTAQTSDKHTNGSDASNRYSEQREPVSERIREQAKQASCQARESIEHGIDAARDQFDVVYSEARNWIQQRPLEAIGIAAGVGIALGMLMRGSRK